MTQCPTSIQSYGSSPSDCGKPLPWLSGAGEARGKHLLGLPMNKRTQQHFKPGEPVVIAADSPVGRFSTVFEDDGETGYFYAYDSDTTTNPILDAVHIYNVSAVVDRQID